MAALASSSSAPALDPTHAAGSLASANAPYMGAINKAADDAKSSLSDIESKRDASLADLDKRMAADPNAELKPPQLEPMPVTKPTDPIHQWGSAAMTLALLGSLMTRQPLTAALNAAAGVMNAYRQGDQQKANAEYAKWKVSNDNYVKLYDYQSKVYERVVGDYRKQREDINNLSVKEQTEKLAELKAYAYANNDMMLANTKTLDEAIKYLDAQDRLHQQALLASPRIEEVYQFQKAEAELKKSPQWQSMSEVQRQQAMMALMRQTAPQAYDEGVKHINETFKDTVLAPLTAHKKAVTDWQAEFVKEHGAGPWTDSKITAAWADGAHKLAAVDAQIEAAYKARDEQLAHVPTDSATDEQRPEPGSGAHKPPPFPAQREGQTATAPNGEKWVVMGGKWVMQPKA